MALCPVRRGPGSYQHPEPSLQGDLTPITMETAGDPFPSDWSPPPIEFLNPRPLQDTQGQRWGDQVISAEGSEPQPADGDPKADLASQSQGAAALEPGTNSLVSTTPTPTPLASAPSLRPSWGPQLLTLTTMWPGVAPNSVPPLPRSLESSTAKIRISVTESWLGWAQRLRCQ